MSKPLTRRVVAGLCATAVAAIGFAAPAMAQTTPATVGIDDCHVKRSPIGGFTWFYCGVTVDATDAVRVDYRSNLATFKPRTGGSWSSRSGTLRFSSSGGQQQLTLKLAVRNRTAAQVRKRLRVTLSNARGATITDATATAAAS